MPADPGRALDAGLRTADVPPDARERAVDASFVRFALGCLLAYALLAVPVGRYADGLLNHDAVSYLSLAHHWLDGRPDLGVSGTWAPAFPWLLAALIGALGDDALALRTAMGLSGAVFLLGALSLYAAVPDRRIARLAAAVTVPFAALFTGTLATPDLLSAGLFFLAFGRYASARTAPAALAAGVLFGAAYLAKAVLLPVGIATIVVLALVERWTARGRGGRAPARAGVALLGVALAAGPWVATLSAKYGEFTLTRSNVPQWAAIGPHDRVRDQPTNVHFIVPEPGRQSQFEDESIVPEPSWSILASPAYFAHFVRIVVENVVRVPVTLSRFDISGVGLLALTFFFARAARRARAGGEPVARDWTALAVPTLLVIGAYLPNFADQMRYYLVATPGLMLGALHGWRAGVDAALDRRDGLGTWLGAAVLLVSTTTIVPLLLPREFEAPSVRAAREVAAALEREGIRGAVAVAGPPWSKHPGIYLSWYLGTPYHGTEEPRTLADVDRSCAPLLVVGHRSDAEALLRSAPARFGSLAERSPAIAAALKDKGFDVYLDSKPVAGRTTCRIAGLG